MRDELGLTREASSQDGLVTRRQILAAGFTDEWIDAQLNARRIRRLHRKVYLMTTGTPTRRQQDRAALLCTGPIAALSHQTAARQYGLQVADDGRTHVTVPYNASAWDRDDVVIHRSRAFAHIVVDDHDLPTVSRADTCLDLAVAQPDARSAMRMLLHAALAMHVTATKLLAVMELRRPARYRTPLRDAAILLAEGVGSVLEAKYAVDVEDAHGLPRAERQVPLAVGGTTRYEDLAYRTPTGLLVVRLDGWRYHSDRFVARIDRARDNAAEIEGRGRLTFGWEEITTAACPTARIVATKLLAMGWVPDVASPCECLSALWHGQALTRR